jgi:ketosteroid isomerase-like protein
MVRHLIAIVLGGLSMPAVAATTTVTFANDAARTAAADPAIAAAIAAGVVAGTSTINHDVDSFAAGQAPEMVVNSPANRVLTGPQTIGAFKAGLIDYASSEHVLEYAAIRPTGERLLMGEEHITPGGNTRNAGHAETYRVTEIWRRDGDCWLCSVRYATITAVK